MTSPRLHWPPAKSLRKPRHDRHVVLCGLLSLTIELGSCSGKAFNARGQYDAGLGRLRPYMARDFNGVGVVVAAARDGPNFRPALKGQANGCTAGWAKVNKDLFLATLGYVLVTRQLTIIELDGIHGENRFREERGASHPLTECAVAGKRAQGWLAGSEPNLATEAATFKYNGHDVDTPICALLSEATLDD